MFLPGQPGDGEAEHPALGHSQRATVPVIWLSSFCGPSTLWGGGNPPLPGPPVSIPTACFSDVLVFIRLLVTLASSRVLWSWVGQGCFVAQMWPLSESDVATELYVEIMAAALNCVPMEPGAPTCKEICSSYENQESMHLGQRETYILAK